jgi:hypothetical protein
MGHSLFTLDTNTTHRDYQGLSHWIQLLEVFTLLELVSLVKVFRLFGLKRIVLFWCCSECAHAR